MALLTAVQMCVCVDDAANKSGRVRACVSVSINGACALLQLHKAEALGSMAKQSVREAQQRQLPW